MNILVIMSDSLRPDHLGCYGNRVVKTPNIDRLAKEGVLFINATAEYPVTVPSRTAFVTGNYTFPTRDWQPLYDHDITLAQILSGKGYKTHAISDTPFNPGHKFNRGFGSFDFYRGGKCDGLPAWVKDVPGHERQVDLDEVYIPPHLSPSDLRYYKNTVISRKEYLAKEGKYFPELLTEDAVKWLKENSDEKFFLWIDYFDPHEPWDPPSPYDQMYNPGYRGKIIPMPAGPSSTYLTGEELKNIIAMYDGCVTQIDDQVGAVWRMLEDLKLLDCTLIVFVSDHGEPFGDHNTIRKFGIPMYEELVRMPLILSCPSLLPRNMRIESLVQNTDLMPTILSLVGSSSLENVDGKDLTPLIKKEQKEVRGKAYCGAYYRKGSVRTQKWKYIANHSGERGPELYDLEDDPKERTNVILENRDTAEELSIEYNNFLKAQIKKFYGEDAQWNGYYIRTSRPVNIVPHGWGRRW